MWAAEIVCCILRRCWSSMGFPTDMNQFQLLGETGAEVRGRQPVMSPAVLLHQRAAVPSLFCRLWRFSAAAAPGGCGEALCFCQWMYSLQQRFNQQTSLETQQLFHKAVQEQLWMFYFHAAQMIGSENSLDTWPHPENLKWKLEDMISVMDAGVTDKELDLVHN